MAYFAASDPVTISASHDERATEVCFFDEQLTVAEPMWKVNPEVECLTAQSESLYPCSGCCPLFAGSGSVRAFLVSLSVLTNINSEL